MESPPGSGASLMIRDIEKLSTHVIPRAALDACNLTASRTDLRAKFDRFRTEKPVVKTDYFAGVKHGIVAAGSNQFSGYPVLGPSGLDLQTLANE